MVNQNPHELESSKIVALTTDRTNRGRQLSECLATAPSSLVAFTTVILLLIYGYEIFNFSLSIDEELVNDTTWWKMYIEHGSWANGVLTRVLPPLGNVPMLATLLFCAGLGVCGCVLARLLFTNKPQQFAFVATFVSSPFWPHLAEFNISSWGTGIGLSLLALSLLLFYSGVRFGDLLATFTLMIACGFVQTFIVLFLIAVCLRHLSGLIEQPHKASHRFPAVSASLVAGGALVGYLTVQVLLLKVLSLHLVHVPMYFGAPRYIQLPVETISRVTRTVASLLTGRHPSFLGYGYVYLLLPAIGLLMLISKVLFELSINRFQRILAAAVLLATLLLGLSPIIITAAVAPVRIFYTLAPIFGFFAALSFFSPRKLEKPLYVGLALTVFVSVWLSVSLFYTDHLARQRDQVLATRIMARVDEILPNPPARIPFVVVGSPPATSVGSFRKSEVFGDSYFDTSHEHGNPFRIAAYLQMLGINNLEPHLLSDADSYRSIIDLMPVWPAKGSVATIHGLLVIKLGPTTFPQP